MCKTARKPGSEHYTNISVLTCHTSFFFIHSKANVFAKYTDESRNVVCLKFG